MVKPTDLNNLDREDLIKLVTELVNRINALEQQLADAQARIHELQEKNAVLERAGQRQATPFARREKVAEPKKAGRHKGKGAFKRREAPAPEDIQVTKKAELGSCSKCGGALVDVKEHEQFEVDLPEVKPIITRYVMLSGYCPECGKEHWFTHPEQISKAVGAAGVVIGPRAKALAADLKHRLGASYAKVTEVVMDAFHLKVTRSAWCQADQRLAEEGRPIYTGLIEALRACSVVHSDETGWRIGPLSAWLWVFTQERLTVYTIESGRSHEVVLKILGKEFKGVLVSDCFLAYDHQALEEWLKQKCLSHLLKDLKALKEAKAKGAIRFAQQVSALLQDALALKARKETTSGEGYAQQAAALEARLDALIAPKRRFSDGDNARFARRLRKQRPHVLRFLYVDDLDATNNLAERQLRPAVITRKTNGCNRAQRGAEAHAILASLLATCRQQAVPILEYLVAMQCFGKTPVDLTTGLAPPE